MNADQYKIWIGNLSQLSPDQTKDVVSRLKLLSQISVTEHSGKQEFNERVLQAVVDVFRKLNVETPSVPVLRKSSSYVSSRNKMQDLAPYFEKISKSRLVQDAILRKGIELLYFDLFAWQGITISSHTLLRQIHRVPASINKAFPGYADSGFLAKLVKGG
jgi:hypothetical protein